MKYILFIATLSFISCNMTDDHIQGFVVPEYNEKYLKDTTKNVPYDYYSQNNIIVHSSKREFYYHDNGTNCGTGWKVTNPPRPIDFEKYPLTKYEKVNDLIDKIHKADNSIKLVILASQSDTIRNKAYFELKEAINDTKDIHLIATRKTTSDEERAIKSNFIIE